ncbi:MAG: hypothetical protein ACOYVD_08515 [Bacillota bacterium]
MKIKPWAMGLIIFVLMFSGIGVSKALDLWITTSSKIPASYKEGEFAGNYNPADIRGSYTFDEVSRLFGIPLEDIARAFHLLDIDKVKVMQVKELESMYEYLKAAGQEIGTGSVRMFTAFYNGLPYSLDEEVFLLKPALEILENKGKITREQLAYLRDHILEAAPEALVRSNSDEGEKVTEPEKTIKGKTTFGELLEWGMTLEEIEGIIGKKVPGNLMTVRDFCVENGMEFSVIRGILQEKLNNQ